jgi:hypothetical protein
MQVDDLRLLNEYREVRVCVRPTPFPAEGLSLLWARLVFELASPNRTPFRVGLARSLSRVRDSTDAFARVTTVCEVGRPTKTRHEISICCKKEHLASLVPGHLAGSESCMLPLAQLGCLLCIA